MAHYRRPWIKGLLAAGYVVQTAAPADEHLERLEALTSSKHQVLTRLAPRSRNGLSDLAFMRELKRTYQRLKPDLIVHFTIKPNIYGGMVARQCGIPYLAVITGLGYTFLHGGWRNQTLVPWLYRQGLKGVKKAIFYNDQDRQLFLDQEIIQMPNAARINGSGVDMDYFQNCPLPTLTAAGPTFLFLGRILRDKGLMELLEATKLLLKKGTKFRLVIAGSLQAMNPEVIDESEFLTTIEAVNKCGQQQLGSASIVTYQPTVADVRPLLANAHIFVLPSYREGLSIAGAEALATGRPVIASNVPGCDTLVTPNSATNGYLVTPRDVHSLAKAMQQMADKSQEELAQMGQASHRLAQQRFAADITTADFIALVKEALAPHS